jgi:electron transport complex protein RnfG
LFFIRQSWLLIAGSFCFGLLIALAGAAWSPRIEQNRIDKLNRLMGGLLPSAQSFEPAGEVEVKSPRGKILGSAVYRAAGGDGVTVGWAFIAVGSGFADKIELVVAVDAAVGTIMGFDCLASNETPGFGDRIKHSFFRDQFEGAPAKSLSLVKAGDAATIDAEIVAITGATVSSEAVVGIINNYIGQVAGMIGSME